ncbi:hypothetical protein BRL76_12930, partial [Xanthomonas oryzae pv. oryzae]
MSISAAPPSGINCCPRPANGRGAAGGRLLWSQVDHRRGRTMQQARHAQGARRRTWAFGAT